jgi:hypothetical protein
MVYTFILVLEASVGSQIACSNKEKKKPCIYLEIDGFRNADCAADRFRTDRRLVKKIFVDETLLKIDGQYYWLWVAYEPTLNACLMIHLSRERRTIFLRMLSVVL